LNGYKLIGDEDGLHLRKGNFEFTFDRTIKSGNGFILGVEMMRTTSNRETAAVALAAGTKVKYERFHGMVGHLGETRVRAMAKHLGIILTGQASRCEDCAVSKARQANLNKETENTSETPGERLCFDISSIKGKSIGGARFWLLVVDEATGHSWSYLLKKKASCPKL